MTALANAILRANPSSEEQYDEYRQYDYTPATSDPQDAVVLEKLTSLFKKCFNSVNSAKNDQSEKKADME